MHCGIILALPVPRYAEMMLDTVWRYEVPVPSTVTNTSQNTCVNWEVGGKSLPPHTKTNK